MPMLTMSPNCNPITSSRPAGPTGMNASPIGQPTRIEPAMSMILA
jgi:hypothetical protein